MYLLITGGDGRLARAVIASLSEDVTVRVVDTRYTAPLPPGIERWEGDLRDLPFAEQAVVGVDAVLHLAPVSPPPLTDLDVVDCATRGTYNLVTAALKAGVQKLLLGSTLDIFDRMPAHWRVSESWRPCPEPSL